MNIPSSGEIIKKLIKNGWELDRINGSHHIFWHPQKSGTVTVPHPRKDLPAGTVAGIKRQARLK